MLATASLALLVAALGVPLVRHAPRGEPDALLTATDLRLLGAGEPGLHVTRSFSSSAGSQVVGNGWSLSYIEHLALHENGDVSHEHPNGVDRYVRRANGDFDAATGSDSVLSRSPDSTFVLRDRTGLKRKFDGAGTLRGYEDRHGRVLVLSYDGSGALDRATDELGSWLEFRWQGGHLAKVVDSHGREVRYDYDERGNLVRVSAPASAR